MRVLALGGSLRRDSYNARLLEAAGRSLPAEVEFEIWSGLAAVPAYDEDVDIDPAPEPVRRLRDAIAGADAVLIATPEYNASIPGALKNALDWASRPFPANVLRGKPAAVIGASTSIFGAVWAQAELRKVLKTIGALVLDGELPVAAAYEAFDGDGELRDGELRARLAEIVDQLVTETCATLKAAA